MIALVTGANKGIGLEVAAGLGRRDFTVLLGARDEARGRAAAARLQESELDVRYAPLDVNDDDTLDFVLAQVQEFFDGRTVR